MYGVRGMLNMCRHGSLPSTVSIFCRTKSFFSLRIPYAGPLTSMMARRAIFYETPNPQTIEHPGPHPKVEQGKVVHPPGSDRPTQRSELYGFKLENHEGPCDQQTATGTVMGKTGSKWANSMRDAQPQKFVDVNGTSYILGVQPPRIEEGHWNALRNELWTPGLVNTPCHLRRRMSIFSNYDFIMKSDYCMFWIPTFIVFSISVPTYCMTYMYDELAYTTMTVKVIGRQWYWVFEVETPTDDDDEDESAEDDADEEEG